MLVDIVEYVDSEFPSDADGSGPSLELKNILWDNNSSINWEASHIDGGTPGSANTAVGNSEEIIDVPNVKISNYPNPFNLSSTNRNSGTKICFELKDDILDAEIVIYNLKGQKVR